MSLIRSFSLILILAEMTWAQVPITGKILTTRSIGEAKEDIALTYRFDGKTLTLTHLGGFLNAAALKTKGTLSITGKKITLTIQEAYDKQGPADSVMRADVLYTAKGLSKGKYRLCIDDNSTEGKSGILLFDLKLTKSNKETLTAPIRPKPRPR